MATLYAVLEPLTTPVKTVTGSEATRINIYRMSFGVAAPMFDMTSSKTRIAAIAKTGCKAMLPNGGGEEEFDPNTLDATDATELVVAFFGMQKAAETYELEGDGVNHPIVYTLKHPLTLDKEGTQITQIEFAARTLGQITTYLDATGEGNSFREFMRAFGSIIGHRMPMTDHIVNALDVEDYAIIKANIMVKLTGSRGRLKLQS